MGFWVRIEMGFGEVGFLLIVGGGFVERRWGLDSIVVGRWG